MVRLSRHRGFEPVVVALLTCLAAGLLLTNLGNQYLWQDEAQTGVIARTILSHGIPLGHDGRNSFSQELGVEYDEGRVWKWHTWLSFYAVACSLLLFGSEAAAVRLPFALFGIATVALTYFTARSFWRDRSAAAAAALLLTCSVPFLLLARQGRWYSMAAFFTLLGLYAYDRLERGGWKPAALLFAAATLVFHTHYVYCATLLLALLVHAALLDRDKLRPVLIVCAGVALFNAPWIVWFATIRYGESYGERLLDPRQSLRIGSAFVRLALQFFFYESLLLVPLALAALRLRRRQRVFALAPRTRRNLWLIASYGATTLAVLSLVSPGVYFRYLAPLAPPLFVAMGLLLGELLRVSKVLGYAALALLVAAGPVCDFLYEITHDFDGPIEGIVAFLHEHGSRSQTVAISYGDMPLKFYTDFRVIGGLTGEEIDVGVPPDWIIIRRGTNTHEDERVKEILRGFLASHEYAAHRLSYPDTLFENREDPRVHRYRTAPARVPRVTLHELER